LRKQELPSWNTNVLTPIVHSNIGIKSLVTDTIVKATDDSSYIISTRIPLTEIRFDTLIKFSEIPFNKDYTLQKLKLDPQTVTQKFSLGEIINQTPFTFINGFNGAMLPPFIAGLLPASIDQGPLGPYYFNANNFFKSATLISGDLDLVINNNLPVDLQNISVQFRNKTSGVIIFERSNIDIMSGSSKSFHEDLAGKVIEGDLEAVIPTIRILTDGLKTKIIDTTKSLDFQMTISNVKVSEAIAVFPNQDVIDENAFIAFQKMGKYEIKSAVLGSGEVGINVLSTAQDSLYFDYKIPSLTTSNGVFETSEKVNPGMVGNPAVYQKTFDFVNYSLDLTKGRIDKDTFNTINSVLIGRIKYSGKLIYLSLKDTLSVNLIMKNLVAASAKGYLGDTTFVVEGESLISNFKKYSSSVFSLDKASIKLNIANGVGVKGEVSIQEFKAYNSLTNQTLSLSGSVISNLYPVGKAIESPFTPVNTVIDINQNNSNITDLIALKPDRITYKVSLKLNPLGNLHTYDDFLLKESSVKVDVDVNIPLSINVENLKLTETVDFAKTGIKDLDKIESGSFNFIVDNQFPFNASPIIYVLNDANVKVDSLLTNDFILAGIADANGRVISKTHSIVKFPFTKSQLNHVSTASKLQFDIKFATPALQFVKLYTDYNMDIKLVGDFIYYLNPNNATK
jgi:hypothetical protein